MSDRSNLIISTQILVGRYESGHVSVDELMATLPTTDRLGSADDSLFPSLLYAYVRPIEAIAYKMRSQDILLDSDLDHRIQWAFSLEQGIRRRLERIHALEPRSDLEEDGKVYREEKLLWALRVITESLPSWGYSPRDATSREV